MRCVCARIRTSFSCISICNLSARPEKGACSQAPFFFPKSVGRVRFDPSMRQLFVGAMER
jgi:hypothetical protein